MSGTESVVVSYVLNSLWQAPLIFAAAWIAARAVRALGPAAEHRVWVGALLLESLLPAVSILPWQRVHIAWPWHGAGAAVGNGEVGVQMGGGAGLAAFQIPQGLMAVLVGIYVSLTLYFVARLLWQMARLAWLLRGTETLMMPGEAAECCAQWGRRFGLGRPVAMVSSSKIFAPVTVGVVRQYVVMPEGMVERLAAEDLDTAIAHEFAHIRRNDFLKNLGYEVLSLPVACHPCLWFTRQRVMETREMICDAMAAGQSGFHCYAESLLRLAALLLQGRPVRIPHAIGVFDANTLERRLMKLTEKKKQVGKARLIASLGVCLALGAATAVSAVALGFGAEQKADAANGVPASIAPEKMQEQLISKVPPVYPPDAKAARVQGKVLLKAVIGKEGHVENLQVISGPRKLQQSAMDAVRQWVYKPYLVNGNPVEVETEINVTYSLKK